MRDTIQVIIAKYQEDVQWADDLDMDYIVYDKSCEQVTGCQCLPNIGREGHTYLTHIVRNYTSLAPVNVFVQGDPFDHIEEGGRSSVNKLKTVVGDIVDKAVPFKGLAWFKLKCDELGRPHDLMEPKNEGRWPGWGRDIPVGEVFESLFDAPMPRQIVARATTGNFVVTRDRILTRPLAFYEYALRLFEADPEDVNNTGHAFERLWQLIFNGNTAWNKENY